MITRLCLLVVALTLLVLPSSVRAEVEYVVRLDRPFVAGDWGRALDDGVAGEVAIRDDRGTWSPSLSVSLASYDMPPPDEEATWSHISVFAGMTARPWRERRVVPFATVMLGYTRIRPESRIFLDDPDRELEPGENPFAANDGVELGMIAGTTVGLFGSAALELGATFGALWTQEADLSVVGEAGASTGTRWGFSVGLVWGPR